MILMYVKQGEDERYKRRNKEKELHVTYICVPAVCQVSPPILVLPPGWACR